MRAGRLAAIVMAGAAIVVLSGCDYLLGLSQLPPDDPLGSFDPGAFESFDPGAEFSLPPPEATFATGSATVRIGTTTTTLDRMAGPAAIYAELGIEATWTDGDGFYLRFYGSGAPDGEEIDYVSLDRIHDGSHWATSDPTVCKVTVSQADARGLVGSATCHGLRWADTMAGFGDGLEPAYIEGEAAFDADVTFQAAP